MARSIEGQLQKTCIYNMISFSDSENCAWASSKASKSDEVEGGFFGAWVSEWDFRLILHALADQEGTSAHTTGWSPPQDCSYQFSRGYDVWQWRYQALE